MTDKEKIIEILERKIELVKEYITSGSYDNNIYNAKLETLESVLNEVDKI